MAAAADETIALIFMEKSKDCTSDVVRPVYLDMSFSLDSSEANMIRDHNKIGTTSIPMRVIII